MYSEWFSFVCVQRRNATVRELPLPENDPSARLQQVASLIHEEALVVDAPLFTIEREPLVFIHIESGRVPRVVKRVVAAGNLEGVEVVLLQTERSRQFVFQVAEHNLARCVVDDIPVGVQ